MESYLKLEDVVHVVKLLFESAISRKWGQSSVMGAPSIVILGGEVMRKHESGSKLEKIIPRVELVIGLIGVGRA